MRPTSAGGEGREPVMGVIRVELSVDTLAGALAADAVGADRVELCAAAYDGGLTPSHGLVAAAVSGCARAEVHVLVRPRGGDFAYTPAEVDAMARDVAHAVALGAAGVVSGVLTPSGAVEPAATGALVAAAGGARFTFHRALDVVADPVAALDVLRGLGVARVLTSGGAPTAAEGADVLAALVRAAGGDLAVMAGGGVRPANAADLVRRTGVRDLHAAPRTPVPRAAGAPATRVDFTSGGAPAGFDRYELDADAGRALVALAAQLSGAAARETSAADTSADPCEADPGTAPSGTPGAP